MGFLQRSEWIFVAIWILLLILNHCLNSLPIVDSNCTLYSYFGESLVCGRF